MIPAQELVEHGLAAAGAAGADGCIVLVEEASHADVRFALNTTTTNGVHRGALGERDRGRRRVGRARRAGPGSSGPTAWPRWWRAALADARGAPPAEDAFALVEPAASPPGARLRSGAGGDGRRGARGRARRRCRARSGGRGPATRCWPASPSSTSRRSTSAARPGLRLSHAQPTAAVNLVGRTADGSGLGLGGRAGHRRRRSRRWSRRSGAGSTGRTRRIALEAGPLRGDPAAVGRRRHDGRAGLRRSRGPGRRGRPHGLLQGGRRRPASARRSRRCPSRSTATPSRRAWSARRSSPRTASSSDVSVFDNGLPARAHRLAARRRAGAPALPPGRRGEVGRGDGALRRQPRAALRRRRRRLGRRHGGPHRAGAPAHLPVVHPRGRPGHPAR